MGMWQDFKKFAVRGNVIDMAVGIILGAAFGKIVTSLVNDLVMPPIGMLLGQVDFSQLAITLRAKTEEATAVTINYGAFLNTVIDFLIVAFCVFVLVRRIRKLQETEQEEEDPKPPTTKDCPRCCSTIPIAATRCPQCTSELANG